MTKNNCNSCGSWVVAGANFCHNCGLSLAPMAFQSSLAIKSPYTPQNREFGQVSGQWKDKASTAFMLALAMGAGAVFADFSPSLVALIPAGYLLWPVANKMILDLMGKLPQPAEGAVTIKVETVTDDHRHWTFDQLPPSISLGQLQHVAEVCLPEPKGRGLAFSRRKVHKTGTFSHGDYDALKGFWLEANFAFYRDAEAPTTGVILTPRCYKLLRKSLEF